MSDLTEFLLARIAEIEARARGSLEYGEGHWRWIDPGERRIKSALVDERGRWVIPVALADVYPSVHVAGHIAYHDPARVLAECEAKRRIVDGLDMTKGHATYLIVLDSVRILATVYADHPDYREDWRP